jgi:neutral ceramidase
MSTLQAGVARRVITPPVGIYLMGYGNREQGNLGVHDDLYVTTIVFECQNTRAAILTVDHTFINPVHIRQVQEQIHSQTGIPSQAIFICCSHVHAAPIGYADEHSRAEDRAYMNFLTRQLVESAVEAYQNLQPVTLRGGVDEAHININRRERTSDGQIIIGNNPDGLVDHSVQVLQVITSQHEVLATLVNYACHPVVMGPKNRLVTADWVGALRRKVESEISGLCLFVQGATADINPRKMRWTDDNWDEVEEQGQEVAAAVIRAQQKMQTLEAGTIQAHQAAQWLPLMPAKGYNDAIRAFLPSGLTDEQIRAAIHETFPWQVELEQRGDKTYSPLYIGVLQMGDFALAALGTEPFTETGLKIKATSPAKMTFVAGYTNGCNSYLPVDSAYDEGGYEVETAPLFYGLPAPFERGSAEVVTQEIIQLLRGNE